MAYFLSPSRLLAALSALLMLMGLIEVQIGLASSFEVSPIRLTFQPNETTSLMTVRNEGEDKLRLQISVMAWDQDKQGEMVLTPTDEIIFYPTLLTIDGRGQRNLRVGGNHKMVAKEQTYRIFVEELPANQKLSTTGVKIVTRMSIPIFFKPVKAEVKYYIERIALRGSDLTFEVKNQGNVHIQPREIRIKGLGADSSIQLDHKIPGWYILAGGLREYRLEVPKAACAKIKNLSVELDLDDKPVKENFFPPPGACAR